MEKKNLRWIIAVVVMLCLTVLIVVLSRRTVEKKDVPVNPAPSSSPVRTLNAVTEAGAGAHSALNKTEEIAEETPDDISTQRKAKIDAQGYTISLDGMHFPYEIISWDDPEQSLPNGVIFISGFYLTIDKPGVYEFTCSETESGILRLKDGKNNRIVAVRVSEESDENYKPIKVNPLEKLSNKEISQLQGISINLWSAGIAEKLKSINRQRVCLAIGGGARQGKKKSLPPLPFSLRFLVIDNDYMDDILDYSLLAKQDSLRIFIVNNYREALDLDLLKNNRNLRCLRVSKGTYNFDALKSFPELHSLALVSCTELSGINFVTAMPHLAYLDIRNTGVKDLSPLNNHPSLCLLDADDSKVSRLDGFIIPRLKNLHVMDTLLNDNQVAVFKKNNPGCIVYFHWNDFLAIGLKKANRMRLVIDERYYSDESGEWPEKPKHRVIYTENDPVKVVGIIKNITIEDKNSGNYCACLSPYIFEFYDGNTLLQAFTLHHGYKLRSNGLLPGDAVLTLKSGIYLSTLFADHGYKEPLNNVKGLIKAEEAARRKSDKISAIIPSNIAEKLKNVKTARQAEEVFARTPGTQEDKALMYIRVLGVEEFSWNVSGGFDAFVVYNLLPKLDKKNLARAFCKAVKSPEGTTGAARLVFWYEVWKPEKDRVSTEEDDGKKENGSGGPLVDKETLQVILPAIARQGLSSPNSTNRTVVINALEEIKGNGSVEALRKFIKGEIKVRPAQEKENEEPGGMALFCKKTAGEGSESGIAHAALVLARLKDKESISVIEKLAKTTTGEDKKVLEQALEMLRK